MLLNIASKEKYRRGEGMRRRGDVGKGEHTKVHGRCTAVVRGDQDAVISDSPTRRKRHRQYQ
jgi:hypothetical protein